MISHVECCDNMEFMARYPDKFFELAIVDPEYGIGADKPSVKPAGIKQKNGTVLNVKSSTILFLLVRNQCQ